MPLPYFSTFSNSVYANDLYCLTELIVLDQSAFLGQERL